MKQKHVMLCIVTTLHIYGYMFSFKNLSWLITCYSSFFLSSKKRDKFKSGKMDSK